MDYRQIFSRTFSPTINVLKFLLPDHLWMIYRDASCYILCQDLSWSLVVWSLFSNLGGLLGSLDRWCDWVTVEGMLRMVSRSFAVEKLTEVGRLTFWKIPLLRQPLQDAWHPRRSKQSFPFLSIVCRCQIILSIPRLSSVTMNRPCFPCICSVDLKSNELSKFA